MASTRIKVFATVAIAAVVAAVPAALWLGSNARQDLPVAVAFQFLGHLHARHFTEAFALAAKSPYVGASAAELERISDRQLCSAAERLVGTGPAQTHGNRVRRWLLGTEIDMPEVHVEFEGGCLLRITLRRSPGRGWHVYSFASHAG